MIALMVYAAVVAGFVAAGGLALERLLAAAGRPRRVAWLAALTFAVVIPLTGLLQDPAPPEVPGAAAAQGETEATTGGSRWSIVPALSLPAGRESARAAAIVWGGGSLAALVVLATVLVLVASARRRWRRGRIHDLDVYVSRRFGPALVGVARPRVVVPAWVLRLEPGARAAIVRHEVEHARARDHLALLFAGLVLAAFPWSPAVWWMCRRLRAAVELDCDQRVIGSGIRAADYGDVLLHAGSRSSGRWGLAPAMSQPKSLLERRLRTMSKTRTKLTATNTALLVGTVAVALVAACDTPIPTDVQEAIVDAMVEENGQDAETAAGLEQRLRIRSSFRLENPPVIYLDGVRVDRLSDLDGLGIADIDPDDIDRIEIVKGSAAQQIFGEEAANGVIQIFTEEESADPSSDSKERTLPKN